MRFVVRNASFATASLGDVILHNWSIKNETILVSGTCLTMSSVDAPRCSRRPQSQFNLASSEKSTDIKLREDVISRSLIDTLHNKLEALDVLPSIAEYHFVDLLTLLPEIVSNCVAMSKIPDWEIAQRHVSNRRADDGSVYKKSKTSKAQQ